MMTAPNSHPQGVPTSIKYPEMPVSEFMRNSARKFPDRHAVVYLGAKHTYGQLWSQSRRLATALNGLGASKGDRVAVLLPNCPQFLVTINAVHLLGGVVVALNPLMPAEEIEREIKVTGCKVLVALDRLLDKVPQCSLTLIVAEAAGYAPPVLRALSRLKNRAELPQGAHRFRELLNAEPLNGGAEAGASDVAVVMFTSGTTGAPKGVMLTHGNLVANALQSYHWLRGWGYSAKPQPAGWPMVLCALPFFHSYGLVVMNEAVSFGCTLVLLPKPTAGDMLKAIERSRVTHFPAIPRMVKEVMSHRDLDDTDLSSLCSCSTGGAKLHISDIKAFEEATGARLYEGYGLTESGPSVSATPIQGDPRYGSVGLPYPDTQVKVMDLQIGEVELNPGEEGELAVQGPQIMKGYWEDPEATSRVLRDGWLYTGDIGWRDRDGYIYVVGRKEDRIHARGHTVHPEHVEEVIQGNPHVEAAVVFGAPDPLRCATDISAAVKLVNSPDAAAVSELELRRYLEERLQEYEVPSRILFTEEIPRTPMGKVDRAAVHAMVEEKIREIMNDAGTG